LPHSSETMVQVAMIRLMLVRLARKQDPQPAPNLELPVAVPAGSQAELVAA
jgi:hypothetical protein